MRPGNPSIDGTVLLLMGNRGPEKMHVTRSDVTTPRYVVQNKSNGITGYYHAAPLYGISSKVFRDRFLQTHEKRRPNQLPAMEAHKRNRADIEIRKRQPIIV